ncbi:PFL_4703 family integrating conjugative element protein [Vibrio sp. 10N.261.46.A3]|uniref:PFL_4703 family integrating conjugative element protein n=1 Tax=Vibrio sp. 10N.261.46.A3 TaxID=3229658 RepID=UPI003551696B
MTQSKLRSALSGRDAHIRSLRVALVCVTSVALFSLWGWHQAGEGIIVHTPPDLTSGTSKPWWEVPKPNVYSFGVQIFTQINRWANEGAVDYEQNLHQYRAYLTPQCFSTLQQDLSQKRTRGELSGRERSLSQIPSLGFDEQRVISKGRDAWVVNADLELKEYVSNELVKHNIIRWPLKVVRYDIDRNANPWGLALDCFDSAPKTVQFANKEAS